MPLTKEAGAVSKLGQQRSNTGPSLSQGLQSSRSPSEERSCASQSKLSFRSVIEYLGCETCIHREHAFY